MKQKRKRLQQLNITMGEEDIMVVDELRDKYAINISKCFKNFIRDYLKKLTSIDSDK